MSETLRPASDLLPRPPRFSALSRRIILFNAVALVVLIGGVIFVQSSSTDLVDERIAGIRQQALIVANTLAQYAAVEDSTKIDIDEAEPLLGQLIEPTGLRARLYGTGGQLEIDTRNLLARNVVQMEELPPLGFWSRMREMANRLYDGLMGVRPFARLQLYVEAGNDGRVYSEVSKAMHGDVATAQRVDENNKLVLSVAVPVQKFKTIYSVLLVSTESGDIDDILREERATLIEVFIVALIVMVISSLFLSSTIAEPVKQLAAAADRVRRGHSGRETIPSMVERGDEIGELSKSLAGMTRALYDRIDTIERFAADVAHELKNPLTSLKNAVEMMAGAKDTAAREQLMGIVRNDVKRIDRLISDISDASRLDAELSRETSNAVDLAHLLETIVEVYKVTQMPRGVTLSLAIDMPGGAVALGRDERLGQVFRNLIDNAISFSRDGAPVTIAARNEGRLARIAVEDEGPGIPPDNLETIFQRFYTERPAEHGFGKNSGLGLSIARQIVESSGGRLWAENREGGGARFVVELPLAKGG
jgi:two-component system, OmpR family, sensor histidine kinase ChvG